jgi:hypothetical protein
VLVVLLQLLWVAAESNGWESTGQWKRRALKVSVGFPMQCVSYTVVRTKGNLPAWVNYPDRNQWLPGLRVSSVFWPLDVLVAVGAYFGFRYVLRYEVGRSISAGFVLGLVAGVLACFTTIESWRPASVWVIAPLMLAGLPLTVCFLTRRARPLWLPLLMLAVALLVMPWMSGRLEHFKADHGFSFDAKSSTIWSPSFEEMVYLPLVCFAVLSVPVLLIRRFVPIFRHYASAA